MRNLYADSCDSCVDPTYMGPRGRSHRLRSCGAPRAGLSAQMRSEGALPFLRGCIKILRCGCDNALRSNLANVWVPQVCVNESQTPCTHAGFLSVTKQMVHSGFILSLEKVIQMAHEFCTPDPAPDNSVGAQSKTPDFPRFLCRFALLIYSRFPTMFKTTCSR